jgi:hypothetical protein
MSLVITMIGDVLKKTKFAKSVAAEMFQNTIKCKNADMFHNTIVKQFANKSLSIMMWTIANLAKNGYAIRNVVM